MTTVGGKVPAARALPTSVTRAAGINLTKSLANEYAPEHILVNTVCLGLVKSAQWERRAKGGDMEGYYREAAKRVPVGRVGEAEEFADLVAFLCSARAGLHHRHRGEFRRRHVRRLLGLSAADQACWIALRRKAAGPDRPREGPVLLELHRLGPAALEHPRAALVGGVVEQARQEVDGHEVLAALLPGLGDLGAARTAMFSSRLTLLLGPQPIAVALELRLPSRA